MSEVVSPESIAAMAARAALEEWMRAHPGPIGEAVRYSLGDEVARTSWSEGFDHCMKVFGLGKYRAEDEAWQSAWAKQALENVITTPEGAESRTT